MGKYRPYIRDGGKGRYDFTLLHSDPAILKEITLDLAKPFFDQDIHKVLALDAAGLALGTLVAYHLNAGLIFVRKGGRTAWDTRSVEITDYSGKPKTLEIAIDALSGNDRVLVVDDWSETGTQLKGAISLAEMAGATVIGAAIIGMEDRVLHDKELSKYILHALELSN